MKSNYKPLIVAVFLVFGGLALRSWSFSASGADKVRSVFSDAHAPASFSSFASRQILIGVAQGAQLTDEEALVQDAGTVAGGPASQSAPTIADEMNDSNSAYASAAIQDPGQPIGSAIDQTNATSYTVKRGDTLSSIAGNFNVTVASIVSANPNIRKKALKSGTTLTIMVPVSQANNQANSSTKTQSSAGAALPNFNSDFILPAQGYNQGILDGSNAVTIENSCGTTVNAAADGVVVADKNIVNTAGGWNDGYGTFVLIEHPFGNAIFTRYTHLETSLVSVGDYVQQGQKIGLMGQTGGANTCSLSFQVLGAQNPLAK
jgi:LysM repeat protein